MKLGFKKHMERNRLSSESTASSTSTSASCRSAMVLAVECIRGTSNAEEWSGSLLHTGDIVEEIKIGGQIHRSPFKNGKSGVQKLLRSSFHNRQTSITVRVGRPGTDGVGASEELTELQACIVPSVIGGKKQYVIRGINDPDYAIRFFDRTEAECLELQASRSSRMQQALDTAKLQDGYVGYPWERRMQGELKVPNSSSFLSILFLPFQPSESDDHSSSAPHNDIDDTLARANAWLNASQSSGVPILFTNIQTESLLTKISGEIASCRNTSSLSDLSKLTNASLYGFEDYHGIDIGVVRAVRLWYSPIGEEYRVTIDIKQGDTKLGFAISRTEEGFIYVSSVLNGDENVPSSRSGLSNLHKDATRASKLLVVSRIDNQKVLPWLVSSTGGIRCFDTVSLSQKLSLHRHAGVTMLIHVFMWDQDRQSSTPQTGGPVRMAPPQTGYPVTPKPDSELSDDDDDDDDAIELRLDRDTAGEASFRFDHFSLPNSWV